jgi:hypothetical protein
MKKLRSGWRGFTSFAVKIKLREKGINFKE